MFYIVIKKMINNHWMTGCLLVGFILVVAMISSIPIYTDGILQRMLMGDLENYQRDNNLFPGDYSINANFESFDKEERYSVYNNLKKNIMENLLPQIPLSTLSVAEEITIEFYSALPFVQREEEPKERYVSLQTVADMEKHINIIYGRLFSPQIKDGILEVMATEKFLKKNNFFVDEIIDISTFDEENVLKVKIVGVFTVNDYQDTFRINSINKSDSIFIDYSLYNREFGQRPSKLLRETNWNFALDYHQITISNIGTIINHLEEHHRLADRYGRSLDISFKVEPILIRYFERERQLIFTLWIIEVPVLILLFFYIFMISNMIITNDQNEIAVYKSRGKSTLHIFFMYLIESLILSLIALICGPPLGFLICKFMGASNGFLEFVNRAPLALTINHTPYVYSFITLVFLIMTMMIPVYFQARLSIVQLKQQKAREQKTSVWKRFYIDILILLIAGYGFYRYQSQQGILKITGVSGTDIGIDPILFLTSTLFILGMGLLFLRAFPLIIRIIYNMGNKFWGPTMYCAMLQVGRTEKKGQFIMLFIIFSIAIGIFDANMARTLNRNIEDRSRYKIGADITIQPVWLKETSAVLTDSEEEDSPYPEETLDSAIHYREPPFIPYTRLNGVDKVTKVFSKTNGKVRFMDEMITDIQLRGIIPYEFGEIAWFRNDLLPFHWYNYLNLLAESPAAMLVSRNFQIKNKLKVGDSISITWGSQSYIQGVVYAFIDYWPGFNPYETSHFNSESYLIVANLSYLQNKLAKDPYQIWMSKKRVHRMKLSTRPLRTKNWKLKNSQVPARRLLSKKMIPC